MVPRTSQNEGNFRFADGPRYVPQWQRRFLPDDEQELLDVTYQEWVDKSVNEEMVTQHFEQGVMALARRHFGLRG